MRVNSCLNYVYFIVNHRASKLLSFALVAQAPLMNDAWQANAIHHMAANGMVVDLLTVVKGCIVGPTLSNLTYRMNFMFVKMSPYNAFIGGSIDNGSLVGVSSGKGVVDVVRKMLVGASDDPSRALCSSSGDVDAADAVRAEQIATRHAMGGMQMYSIANESIDIDLAAKTLQQLIHERGCVYVTFRLSIDVSSLKDEVGENKRLCIIVPRPEQLQSEEAKQLLRDLHALDLPEKPCVILDFTSDCEYVVDGVLTVPDGFLSDVPIEELVLWNSTADVTAIGNNFLKDSPFFPVLSGLKSIDMSRWENLQSVGDYFMDGCKGLKSMDVSGWVNLQSVGDYFMDGCKGLKSMDVSGWVNLQSVGDCFMAYCRGLKSVDVSGWENLQSVGNDFMEGCRGLESMDASGWVNLQSVGDCFMTYCNELKSMDVSGWENLQSVGNDFMEGCRGLESMDVSGWENLQSVGDCFMAYCNELKSMDVSGLSGVTSIGEMFMEGTGCGEVDMSWFRGERR